MPDIKKSKYNLRFRKLPGPQFLVGGATVRSTLSKPPLHPNIWLRRVALESSIRKLHVTQTHLWSTNYQCHTKNTPSTPACYSKLLCNR